MSKCYIWCPSGEVLMQSGDANQVFEAFEKPVNLAPNDENLVLSAAHCLRYMLLGVKICVYTMFFKKQSVGGQVTIWWWCLV